MDAHAPLPGAVARGARSARRESFWTSLSYFNLYRIALATLFFAVTLIYGDALGLGSHALDLFRYTAPPISFGAIAFHGVLRTVRERFNAAALAAGRASTSSPSPC